jgi:ketosteroid isomerase-like protein
MSNDNVELMRRAYEAFGRGDMATVMEAFDENISWNAPDVLPHAMSVTGKDGVGKFFERIPATWQEFGLELDDLFASDDRGCAFGRANGTLDGAAASYRWAHVWTIRDGVCVRFDEYVDPSTELITRAAR